MRGITRAVPLALACLLTLTVFADAQTASRNERVGLWGALGVGGGALDAFDCDGCDSEFGFSGASHIGGTLNPSVRLAVGTNNWYKSIEGTGFWASVISGKVFFYPGAKDFFVTGGIGLEVLTCDGCDTRTGVGFVAGAGYDFPINRTGSLALTPFANWVVMTSENTPYFIQFGLGLTFN